MGVRDDGGKETKVNTDVNVDKTNHLRELSGLEITENNASVFVSESSLDKAATLDSSSLQNLICRSVFERD